MQIHYRGTFIVLLTGMGLTSGLAYFEQSTTIEPDPPKRQTAHWADINTTTILSIDFMVDTATVRTNGTKEA
jgi:hypothetical protein